MCPIRCVRLLTRILDMPPFPPPALLLFTLCIFFPYLTDDPCFMYLSAQHNKGFAPYYLLGTEPEGGSSSVLLIPDPVRLALHALRKSHPPGFKAGECFGQHNLRPQGALGRNGVCFCLWCLWCTHDGSLCFVPSPGLLGRIYPRYQECCGVYSWL